MDLSIILDNDQLDAHLLYFSCLILHVLLYQMAALTLYDFILMFLYWYTCFSLQIFMFC